jgi:hypothetical protein
MFLRNRTARESPIPVFVARNPAGSAQCPSALRAHEASRLLDRV